MAVLRAMFAPPCRAWKRRAGRMRGARSSPSPILKRCIGGEAVMAIIGHPDGFRLVRPRNGDEHRSEDFLSRETPIVGAIGEDGGHGEIALGERSGHGRHAAPDKGDFRPFEALLDIAADLLELPRVN